MSTPQSHPARRLTALSLTGVIGIAIAGFLVGMNDGVPREDFEPAAHSIDVLHQEEIAANSGQAIPAVSYSEMRQAEFGSSGKSTPTLQRIHSGAGFQRCISCHDPHSSKVSANQQDKLESLAIRASRRAFNGAPPVIPHVIDRTNDAACYACHGEGAIVDGRVANRMSHGPLANCMQCHAAPPPQPFAHLEKEPHNSFVGLPAPQAGHRAYHGAPPVIPHSTWMRQRCLSCHGGLVGWPGLEVTHRWRTNCMQCHATSSQLDQVVAGSPQVLGETLAGRW